MNIGTLLPRHARYRADHLAVVFQEQRLTFAQFNRRVNRFANVLLDLGVVRGEKVATILPNCLEQLEAYWAAAKIGVVIVPLSPLLRGAGLTRLVNDADAVAVVTNRAFADILTPLRQELGKIGPDRYLLTDAQDVPGYRSYHELTAAASAEESPAAAIGRDVGAIEAPEKRTGGGDIGDRRRRRQRGKGQGRRGDRD